MDELRRATLKDLGAIEQCARLAYQPYVARIGQPPAPMVADFRSGIENGHVFVLDDAGGGIGGYVVFFERDDHMFLENVAVPPSHQGKGLGRQLIAHVERQAGIAGLATVRLYTNIHMRENLGLYTALGYVEYDRRREDGFDRVYFEKHLA